MGLADELLNNVGQAYSVEVEPEPHIVVNRDRTIVVPEKLKRLAVRYDHNIETVTFDCIRSWDNHDMSQMSVYINYQRADNLQGSYLVTNLVVDEDDDSIMHFDWVIDSNVTECAGELAFLVCVKKMDEDEFEEIIHWNSELCRETYISDGLEGEEIPDEPTLDVINQLAEQVDGFATDLDDAKGELYTHVDKVSDEIGLNITHAKTELISQVETVEGSLNSIRSDMNSLNERCLVLEQETSDLRTTDGIIYDSVDQLNTKVQQVTGQYELVEEITTTEDLTTISRTAFPDGTAYQFKAAKVKMVIAAGAGSGNINISYQNKDYLTLSISSIQTIATSQRYHWSRAWKEYGLWECEFSNASASKFAVATYQMAGYGEIIDASNIERISIQATTSGVPIPIGTNIKIYGVRA